MGARALLVTGFEPFGGETVNASWEAARTLDGWRWGDHVAVSLMLPCAYDACVGEFIEGFERMKPVAVLMTGQAAGRSLVCVERFARNAANAARPDNRGVVRGEGPLDLGPERIEATAPVGEIARAIRDAGLPARVSANAGDYVCNHLYYGVLNHLRGASCAAPAVFLHVPATPEQTPARANARRLPTADATRALLAAAAAMARLANRAKMSD